MEDQEWKEWPFDPRGDSEWVLDTNEDIRKIVTYGSKKFVLTLNGHLYGCPEDWPYNGQVVDISQKAEEALLVLSSGQALLVTAQDFQTQSFIQAKDLLKTSPKFVQCTSGLNHLVLLDSQGCLWSSGDKIQSGHFLQNDTNNPDQVHKIEYFQGHKVLNINAGDDFTLALVKKTEHNSGQVLNGTPIEEHSCPLGLPINEEPAVVLRSKNVKKIKPKTESISELMEENDDEEPKVERLAQSGLYILNANEAVKFLSKQMSWIGIGTTPVSEGIEEKVVRTSVAEEASEKEVFEVESGLSRASSFVSESMKFAVSKLSRSFSTERTNEVVECNFDDISSMDPNASSIIPMSTLNTSLQDNQSSPTKSSKSMPILKRLTHRRSQSVASNLSKLSFKIDSKVKNDPFTNEVWSWGKGRRGQPGHGDMLDRLQPSSIADLNGLGVIKIATGEKHSLVMTITGQVYGWGDNSKGQACPKYGLAVCPMPQLIPLPTGETACDVTAAKSQSFILTDIGHVYTFGSITDEESSEEKQKFRQMTLELEDGNFIRKIISGPNGISGSILKDSFLPLCNFKALEKLFLHKLREIHTRILEPLCATIGVEDKSLTKAKETLMECSSNISSIVAQNVLASLDICQLSEFVNVALIFKKSQDFFKAFEEYVKAITDVIVIDVLKVPFNSKLNQTVQDLLQDLCHQESSALQVLLINPTCQLDQYLSCLHAIQMACNSDPKLMASLAYDNLEKLISSMKNTQKNVNKVKKSMTKTQEFWQNSTTTKLTNLKSPTRRLCLDSRDSFITISQSNFGINKHWFILFNDILVHAGYTTHVIHPLQTIWIETNHLPSSPTTETNPNVKVDLEISLILPEESLILAAENHQAKNEWLLNLQRCINETLSGPNNDQVRTPPLTRNTSYTFSKLPDLKGAEYEGSWLQAKMHGKGCLRWPDGRYFQGQFRQNQRHGFGKMEIPEGRSKTTFEGQWKFDKFEGHGKIIYANGDVYQGMVKDGKPHGQGVMKQGKFIGSEASVYIGEWSQGLRSGYGVLDHIISGEKYMGMWSHDMKSGLGCVVTIDGVYYEGTFSHNKMSGKGLMIFEDETTYEGNFADTGVFSGVGSMVTPNGDRFEGSFYGNYTDGMKFNGTIFKVVQSPQSPKDQEDFHPGNDKIGKHTVQADQKWKSIYSHYYDIFSLPEPDSRVSFLNTPVIWEQLAISINQAKNNAKLEFYKKIHHHGSNMSLDVDLDGIEMIPDYFAQELTMEYLNNVKTYLNKAFNSPFHPLANLLNSLADCYTSTYGGVRVHPRLLKHAVDELHSMVDGVYYFIRALFPALPRIGDCKVIELEDKCTGQDKGEFVTMTSIVFPYILPRLHPSVFMLYALHYKREDDGYWARILKWNKHPDLALLSFLEVNKKFWSIEDASAATEKNVHFTKAIETLQQLKTTFTPLEKLEVLLETFKEVNRIGTETCGSTFCWSMDDLFPVFQYIVVRSRILQLGAEIHMIQDLMESHFATGEYGIMFTTLQASYYQILNESISMV